MMVCFNKTIDAEPCMNESYYYTHPKWKLYSVNYTFIMGFTMHKEKTPVPPNGGIQSV